MSATRGKIASSSLLFFSLFIAPDLVSEESPTSLVEFDDWTIQHFQQAKQAQQQNKLDVAAEQYRLILARNPRLAEIYLNLGIVYYLQKKYQEAIKTLQAGLAIKPDMLGAQVLLGIGLYMIQDFHEALKPLTEALRRNRKERQAGVYLALTYIALDEPEKAARQLRQTASYFPGDVEVLYHLGSAYSEGVRESAHVLREAGHDSSLYHWAFALSAERKNDLTASIQEYLKALAIDPNIPQIYWRLAILFQRAGIAELSEAARGRFALFRLNPRLETTSSDELALDQSDKVTGVAKEEYLRLWEGLPSVQLEAGLPRVGDTFVNTAVRDELRSGKHSEFGAAWSHFEDGDYKCAAEELQKLIQHRPKDWVPAYLLARTYLEEGNFDGAEDVVEARLAICYQLPSVALLKIEIQTELASRCYNLVVSKQPDSFRAKVLLAKSYAAGFQPDKAIIEYQGILKLRPNLPEIHLALGELYADRLHWSEAIQHFVEELKLSPDNALAHALLGHAYAEAHDPDRAIEVLNVVVERYPRDANALADLGKAWTLKGDLTKAISCYERALICDESQYEVHYRLFQLYRSIGQTRLAQKHLQEFQVAAVKRKKANVVAAN